MLLSNLLRENVCMFVNVVIEVNTGRTCRRHLTNVRSAQRENKEWFKQKDMKILSRRFNIFQHSKIHVRY